MPMKSNGEAVPKQYRGFAAMPKDKQLAICCLGGKATVKRHGKRYMRRLGRHGRAVRTRKEKLLRLSSSAE